MEKKASIVQVNVSQKRSMDLFSGVEESFIPLKRPL